jgi:hypothetical protein
MTLMLNHLSASLMRQVRITVMVSTPTRQPVMVQAEPWLACAKPRAMLAASTQTTNKTRSDRTAFMFLTCLSTTQIRAQLHNPSQRPISARRDHAFKGIAIFHRGLKHFACHLIAMPSIGKNVRFAGHQCGNIPLPLLWN